MVLGQRKMSAKLRSVRALSFTPVL